MPTLDLPGPYTIRFYSSDCNEPMHVHVRRERNEAKFWLQPVEVDRPGGFGPHELRRIEKIIVANHALLLAKWHEHCGR